MGFAGSQASVLSAQRAARSEARRCRRARGEDPYTWAFTRTRSLASRAAFYETEHEEVGGKRKLERFPSGFYEELDIETAFLKVEAWIKLGEHCVDVNGEGAEDKSQGRRTGRAQGRLSPALSDV